MAFQKSNTTKLKYMAESTWGTIPATALKLLRFTGESFSANQQTTESEEIVSTRGVAAMMATGYDAQGSVNFEMMYGEYDTLIEALLGGTWTSTSVTGTDIAAVALTNRLTSVAEAFDGFLVGQWVKVAGFTGTLANNGYGRITAIGTNGAYLDIDPKTLDFTDDAAGESVTVSGQCVRSGTTERSFTIEKEFPDVTQFFSYPGMKVSKMSMSADVGAKIAGSFDFMGKTETLAQATVGTGADQAAGTTRPMTTSSHVTSFRENMDVMSSTYLMKFSLDIDASVRTQAGIGTQAKVGALMGTERVSGSVSFYFTDQTLYAKYRNETETSFSFQMTDASGNVLIITIPRVRLSGGKVVAGGIDQDVMVEMNYNGLSTSGYQIQFDRFPAA